jgi:multidrug efflux pump subunit AcrB
MVKFLLNKPIAVTMTFIAIMIVGMVSVTKIPVSLMPDIAIPEITVQVSSENTPARELENSIVRSLRQQLLQVAHLDDINSETSDGNSTIRLQFAYGTDINYAFIEVNEKVDRAMGYMPKEMERPKVIKANVSDVPVFYLNLTLKDSKLQVSSSKMQVSDSKLQVSSSRLTKPETSNLKLEMRSNAEQFLELSRFAANVIRKRLEQLPEVAMADMSGLVKSEIMIIPDEEKLDALQLNLNRLESIIASNNIQLGNLSIKDGQYIYNIRFESAIRSKHDIENIYFKVDNRLLQLKDIAQVVEQPQKLKGKVISNNGETVTLAVIKQSNAQMRQLKKSLHGLIAHFEADYPGIRFEIVRDQTKLLDYSINNLKSSLLWGALLAFFVMFLFLRDTRSPMLIGISVPVALVLSLLFFHLAGISINIISLSGLILGVGMMVDNSIIVIDNITQHYERSSKFQVPGSKLTSEQNDSKFQVPGSKLNSEQPSTCNLELETPNLKPESERSGDQRSEAKLNLKPETCNLQLLKKSCISGTNEVIRPLLSSVLTTCAVFIPLIFIKGITGALFYDQAMAIAIGLFASLAVSITILPVYYLLFFRKGRRSKIDRWMQKVNSIDYEELYERGFRFTLRNQKTVWFIVLLMLVASVALYKALPMGKLPPMEKDDMLVHIDWNDRINIEENEARLSMVMQGLEGYLENFTGMIGEQQFLMSKTETGGQAEAVLYLKLKSPELIDSVKTRAGSLVQQISPRASCSFSDADNIFNVVFADNEQPLVARLRATNDYRKQYKHHLKGTRQMLADSLNMQLSPIVWQEQTVLVASSEKLLLYNVPYNELYNKLKTLFSENRIAVITDNNDFVPVVMGGIPRNLDQVISETSIKNSNGEHIPVRELFSRQPDYDLKTILAGKEGEYYAINLPLGKDKPENLMGRVRQLLKNDKLFEAAFTGSYFSNREMVKQLVIILLISLSLLFFILAAQFESLSLPFIVLLEVPIDLFGALLFLWLFGSSINLMSLIGIVVMSGIIINDSILKVDTINQLRKEGYSTLRALSVAGKRRLKPILMTSITTILALTPFLFTGGTGSDLQRPLALAIIGGMLVGTVVSLYFIPLSYYYLKRNNSKFQVSSSKLSTERDDYKFQVPGSKLSTERDDSKFQVSSSKLSTEQPET